MTVVAIEVQFVYSSMVVAMQVFCDDASVNCGSARVIAHSGNFKKTRTDK